MSQLTVIMESSKRFTITVTGQGGHTKNAEGNTQGIQEREINPPQPSFTIHLQWTTDSPYII